MSQYFLKSYKLFVGFIKVRVDVRNYATKRDIKKVPHVDTSFVLQSNLASLKTEVNKLDIDKLVTIPVDLSKPKVVVKNDVLQKLYMIN